MSKIQGTLAQWRDRLRRKELSPAELVNLTADAIEADRTTNAYISFDREAALHAAAGADISSPLAGIPIAVKDNINVLGQPTRCVSMGAPKMIRACPMVPRPKMPSAAPWRAFGTQPET